MNIRAEQLHFLSHSSRIFGVLVHLDETHSLAMFHNSMYYVRACSVVGALWQCPGAESYLESESSETPSGTQRSKRSEACNYWSPHGLLWGRSGSSAACCSCTLVAEEKAHREVHANGKRVIYTLQRQGPEQYSQRRDWQLENKLVQKQALTRGLMG